MTSCRHLALFFGAVIISRINCVLLVGLMATTRRPTTGEAPDPAVLHLMEILRLCQYFARFFDLDAAILAPQ